LALNPPVPSDELDKPNTGNRFDSPLGVYRTLYFGTQLEACFGETLARFRPDLELLAVIGEEWRELGFMPLGEVPRDWRQRRLAVRVRFPASQDRFPGGIRFVDVDSIDTREHLRTELASILAYYGYPDMDVATVHAHDRRVTRWIGQWVYDQRDPDGFPLYAGIRYSSRLHAGWECWAAYEDVQMTTLASHPIMEADATLRRVARRYSLRVH
jgi:hypothetical protein